MPASQAPETSARITEIHVNGARHTIDAAADTPLLSVLRDQLDLTGSKFGCGEGQCGACTVLIDGNPRRSCITPVGAAAKKQITTIEGVEQNGRLHPLQQAFLEEDAMQCAYCTSGMIMTGVALLKSNPSPTDAQIVEYMQGNICRCGTYPRIVAAVHRAAGADQALGRRLSREGRKPMSPNRAAEILPGNEPEIAIEPERYELRAKPSYNFELDRRDFVKIFGAGIAVFLVAKGAFAQQGESGGRRGGFGGEQMPKEISAWLHVNEDGAITVYTGKVEIGQNIRTSLAQAVAEEMHAPFQSIALVMGDTQLTPFDMGTFGSRSTPQMGTQLRHVAAAACDILVDIAAKQWNVEPHAAGGGQRQGHRPAERALAQLWPTRARPGACASDSRHRSARAAG